MADEQLGEDVGRDYEAENVRLKSPGWEREWMDRGT